MKCEICGCEPCITPGFCEACRAADRARDDLPQPVTPVTPDAPRSVLEAAAWLWFQVGDAARFEAFVSRQNAVDHVAILQHIESIEAKRHAADER